MYLYRFRKAVQMHWCYNQIPLYRCMKPYTSIHSSYEDLKLSKNLAMIRLNFIVSIIKS